MVLHTGDVTHLSKPEEFDTAAQILKSVKQDIHYVPGEHDVIGDDGKQFFERFAPKTEDRRLVQLRPGRRAFRRRSSTC